MFKSTVQRLAITRGPPPQQPARLAIDPLKLPRLTIHNNPFRAKKEWPPDFSKLHPKHQFRFEKRYRRRAKLRYLPPNWVRGVKIAANSSVVCSCALFPFPDFSSHGHGDWGLEILLIDCCGLIVVLVFAIFFMDWGDMVGLDGETPPFEGVSSLYSFFLPAWIWAGE